MEVVRHLARTRLACRKRSEVDAGVCPDKNSGVFCARERWQCSCIGTRQISAMRNQEERGMAIDVTASVRVQTPIAHNHQRHQIKAHHVR